MCLEGRLAKKMELVKEPSEYPTSTLPQRGEYERAIAHWWPGEGGRVRLIVDALRRGGATVSEATVLAQRLASRAATGYGYMSAEMLDEQLEDTRAAIAAKSGRLTSGPTFDMDRCVFADGVACPQCSEWETTPLVHGRLVATPAIPLPKMEDEDYRVWMRAVGDAWREDRNVAAE